jgi:hypothetical protein
MPVAAAAASTSASAVAPNAALLEQLVPGASNEAAPQATACSMRAGYKTLIAYSDFEGDDGKLEALIESSHHIAKRAAKNNNELRYALLGDLVSDGVFSSVDPCTRLLDWTRLPSSSLHDMNVTPSQVHLVLGGREIAMIRLFERESGEFAMGKPSKDGIVVMERALKQTSPLPGHWSAYDRDIVSAFGSGSFVANAGDDSVEITKAHAALTVCLFLKLECFCAMTKRSAYESDHRPGFLRNVLKRGMKADQFASFNQDASLRCAASGSFGPVGSETRWLLHYVHRFLKNGKLSGSGLRFASFAYGALAIFFAYIRDTIQPLLRHGLLVECVAPPFGHDPVDGIWLMHGGTSDGLDGTIVGRLPVETVEKTDGIVVHWSEISHTDQLEWKDALNNLWRVFVDALIAGQVSSADLNRWIGLAIPDTGSGPTQSRAQNQLDGLGSSRFDSPTIGLVGHIHAPFGTIRLKTEDKHTVAMCGCACTDHYDSKYYAVATWCAKTKQDLVKHHHVDRSLSLEEVQIDVDIVFSTLFQTLWIKNVETRGHIGPVVRAGRDNKELMRVVWWDDDVITLLPEAYIRAVLEEAAQISIPQSAVVAVVGNLLISRAGGEVVPLKLGQLSPAEEIDERLEMGARIWKLIQHTSDETDGTAFHTRTSSRDAFTGLRVGIEARAMHAKLVAL